MSQELRNIARRTLIATLLGGTALNANADVITDWSIKTGDFITESKLGTPPAIRVMALVQTAAYEAVQASRGGASVEAAVAAAHRATLVKLLPAQQAAIEAAYQAALASVPEGPAKAAGIVIGERAAGTTFAQRASDSITAEAYRPHTTAGVYVPTAAPAAPTWSLRTTWQLTSPAQLRAAPPPALTSVTWARDYNEVKDFGAKGSTKRSAEQTEIARFWEYSLPAIYFGVVRSVATQPGRDVTRNARLFAAAAQALDDGMVGVFDSKYQYNFWRPATAIRNGDIDSNDETARDASWSPLVGEPMHPEYPSAHATLAGAVGAVLKAEIGTGAMPVLATSSPTAKGATRRWTSVDEFVREVADSRIYAGIHYRFSTDTGIALGKNIGELAARRVLQPGDSVVRNTY
ncbi:MAG: PA-phosphatase [Burkholderiaceae bacterium]|nr:PA-phosphatase [Burkholderiaceae bacterium]